MAHPHEDAALFREALGFTSAQTGFAERLIEKDYFCTLVLQGLFSQPTELVFRGGTCLAKVHVGFYRLSEDLDFLISTALGSRPSDRSRLAKAPRSAVVGLAKTLPGLEVSKGLTGSNKSRQYAAEVRYASLVSGEQGSIKIEIGLREPLLLAAIQGQARTILLDPISGDAMLPPFALACVSWDEAMAEKLRAALSRRDPAIRDFYDVDYAMRRKGFDPDGIVAMVRAKLAMPDNGPVDVSRPRFDALQPQVDAELKPVLRGADFAEFDLKRAFEAVARVAAAL